MSIDIEKILYQYLKDDWRLFPVKFDKTPYEKGGFHKFTQTQQGIKEFLKRYQGCNWAGWLPRQFIIDIDVKRVNGFESLEKIEGYLGKLPVTRTHKSGSGGQHRIYIQPPGYNISKADPISKDYPGVDLQANDCYIVLPPSRIELGIYEVIDNSPIIEAPKWLCDFAIKCKTESKNISEFSNNDSEFIPQGQQDTWLYSRASSYRRWGDSEEIIFKKLKIDLLRCVDQDPRKPYTDKNLLRISKSSTRYQPEINQATPITYAVKTSGKL